MGLKNNRIYSYVYNRYDEAYPPNKVPTADNHYVISGSELLDLSYRAGHSKIADNTARCSLKGAED